MHIKCYLENTRLLAKRRRFSPLAKEQINMTNNVWFQLSVINQQMFDSTFSANDINL